jgi:ethanolaminephosphotransferase
MVLMILAVTFKVAFTNEDDPQLIGVLAKEILNKFAGWSLITRARLIFQALGICLTFSIGCEFWYSTRSVPGFRNCKLG